MIKPKTKSIRPNLAVARLTVETQTNQKKRRVLVVEVEAAGAAVEGVVIFRSTTCPGNACQMGKRLTGGAPEND